MAVPSPLLSRPLPPPPVLKVRPVRYWWYSESAAEWWYDGEVDEEPPLCKLDFVYALKFSVQ